MLVMLICIDGNTSVSNKLSLSSYCTFFFFFFFYRLLLLHVIVCYSSSVQGNFLNDKYRHVAFGSSSCLENHCPSKPLAPTFQPEKPSATPSGMQSSSPSVPSNVWKRVIGPETVGLVNPCIFPGLAPLGLLGLEACLPPCKYTAYPLLHQSSSLKQLSSRFNDTKSVIV